MKKELYLCTACVEKMRDGYKVTPQRMCAKHLCQLCRKVSISNLCWVEGKRKESGTNGEEQYHDAAEPER